MSCGSALVTACEVAVLIASGPAVSVRFCACTEGPRSRADTDLRIPLAHTQVRVEEADLCPPFSPFEKVSALWPRSINPLTCQMHQTKCNPAAKILERRRLLQQRANPGQSLLGSESLQKQGCRAGAPADLRPVQTNMQG